MTLTIIGLVVGVILGVGYAAYTDYQDNYDIDGSIGWEKYWGYGVIGGAIGAGIGFAIGYWGPAALAYLGKLGAPNALAVAGGGTVSVAKVVALEAILAVGTLRIAVSYMSYESKKADPRIKSNTKKRAYDKAFHKGGKKEPKFHPHGKYGPHFHPANPKFKHWHYYFSILLGALGLDFDE